LKGIKNNRISNRISCSECRLSGAYEQNVVLDLGGIFDIGLSIVGGTSKQLDALYLADGPWGLDYSATETTILHL
jgi:hypothetical protein